MIKFKTASTSHIKIFLFLPVATIFAVLCSMIFNNNQVNAWASNIPVCGVEDMMQYSDEQMLKNATPGFNSSKNYLIYRSIHIANNRYSDADVMIYAGDNEIGIHEDNNFNGLKPYLTINSPYGQSAGYPVKVINSHDPNSLSYLKPTISAWLTISHTPTDLTAASSNNAPIKCMHPDFNGITVYQGYTGDLFSPPTPPEDETDPLVRYEIRNQRGQFEVTNEPEQVTKFEWVISRGNLEGNPQLEVWELESTGNNPMIFDFPYIRKGDEDVSTGTYSVQVKMLDANNEQVGHITSILVYISEDKINNFKGTCSALECENTPISGEYSTDLWINCTISETFPFFTIDECIGFLNTVSETMKIENTTIGINFSDMIENDSCHNLSVLDDWLNLPDDYEVCAIIPKGVRDITTPFIIFSFGLVALTFIMKKSNENG